MNVASLGLGGVHHSMIRVNLEEGESQGVLDSVLSTPMHMNT